MDIIITPTRLSGSVCAVSSKSDAHRKIIAAALSDEPCEIILNRLSDDIEATIACIKALGGGCQNTKNGLLITPIKPIDKEISLDFCESGSTARFILPVAASLYERCTFTGRGRLPERPFLELTTQLRKGGVTVSADLLPIKTSGRLKSGDFSLSGKVSSQYLTGLLFALPLLEGKSTITLTSPMESQGYIDMTLDTLSEFGVKITKENNTYEILPQKYHSPKSCTVEGDWSNAAFWIALDKICGNIEVTGLSNNSYQGDKAILDILDDTEIDASQIPDLVPILTVLAASKEGKTVIKNASRLRLKESDRLKAMADTINNLGGEAYETDDGIEVIGKGYLDGGTVLGYNDHRVVMSAAIASCICKNQVIIKGAEAVRKSYPTFFEDFTLLGGKIDV